jgi:DNA-binding GntR family transcriptional regulator
MNQGDIAALSTDTLFISAVESAYNQIRSKILSGELEQGRQLSKRKMAQLTGTSVIPVIDALNQLTEDGLVETRPRWGSRVTVYNKEKIEDLYMLRMAIECQIIRILAERMTSDQHLTCKDVTDKLDSYKYKTTGVEEISTLHYKFHTMLADMAGYPSLIKMLKRCNLAWMLFAADKKKSRLRELPEHWHGQLLDGIMTRDPDKAEALMRVHVYDSFQDFI